MNVQPYDGGQGHHYAVNFSNPRVPDVDSARYHIGVSTNVQTPGDCCLPSGDYFLSSEHGTSYRNNGRDAYSGIGKVTWYDHQASQPVAGRGGKRAQRRAAKTLTKRLSDTIVSNFNAAFGQWFTKGSGQ